MYLISSAFFSIVGARTSRSALLCLHASISSSFPGKSIDAIILFLFPEFSSGIGSGDIGDFRKVHGKKVRLVGARIIYFEALGARIR